MRRLLFPLFLALFIIAGCDSVDGLESTSDAPEEFVVSGPDALGKKSDNPKWDKDNNGIADAGVYVTGHYTSLYAYDGAGDYYWDLGDGRIYQTVDSPDDLDAATSTTCDYVNNYRADFGNDPFMDRGWIQNHIKCTGFEKATYNYLIVHESDRRYTGNPDNAIWGTWEYKVLTISGEGNLAKRIVGPQTQQ